jgi:hypothetical protein
MVAAFQQSICFWELLSILSLTMLGIFYLFDRIISSRFPMAKLTLLFLISVASLVLWVRIELAVPPFWVGAMVDLILATAMAVIALNFVMLVLDACSLRMPYHIKKWFFIVVLIGFGIFAFYLFTYASREEFAHFDAFVSYWVRPIWILVFLTVLARLKD